MKNAINIRKTKQTIYKVLYSTAKLCRIQECKVCVIFQNQSLNFTLMELKRKQMHDYHSKCKKIAFDKSECLLVIKSHHK